MYIEYKKNVWFVLNIKWLFETTVTCKNVHFSKYFIGMASFVLINTGAFEILWLNNLAEEFQII